MFKYESMAQNKKALNSFNFSKSEKIIVKYFT